MSPNWDIIFATIAENFSKHTRAILHDLGIQITTGHAYTKRYDAKIHSLVKMMLYRCTPSRTAHDMVTFIQTQGGPAAISTDPLLVELTKLQNNDLNEHLPPITVGGLWRELAMDLEAMLKVDSALFKHQPTQKEDGVSISANNATPTPSQPAPKPSANIAALATPPADQGIEEFIKEFQNFGTDNTGNTLVVVTTSKLEHSLNVACAYYRAPDLYSG